MKVLEVENVSKSIGKNAILKNISFHIKEGEKVGFIGPNGSGKTTTMRTITNLIFQDDGKISICGHDILKKREKALSNISAIIENPSLYEHLSGKDNLELIRKLNKIPKENMKNMVKIVDLTDRINDKVKNYSLGMKQRLALAMCLLKEPKLIILDEPTNGLDPTGTMQLRNILKTLSKDKKISMLISSHNLSEIEKICDRFIYIKEGEIIVTKAYDKNNNIKNIKLNVLDIEKVKQILKKTNLIKGFNMDNNEVSISLDNDNVSELLSLFAQNNIKYTGLEILDSRLEKEYSDIYGGDR